jgi:hypothetical protein
VAQRAVEQAGDVTARARLRAAHGGPQEEDPSLGAREGPQALPESFDGSPHAPVAPDDAPLRRRAAPPLRGPGA